MSTTSHIPQRDVAIPAQRSGEPPYAATLQHCGLLRRKIDQLTERLSESMAQLYISVDRSHHRDGKDFAWWMAYPCESREAAYLLEDGLLAARKMKLNRKAGR